MPDAPDAWQVQATAAHRVLVERDASGARLLKESGPLARLRITAPVRWAGPGRLDVSASAAHARLDYDGRTQAGAPLATASRHWEAEGGLRWRPLATQAWGDVSVTLDALWFRREIAASTAAAGLRETSVLWLAGLGWSGPRWDAGVPVSLHAGWRRSVHHRLEIDYAGLFDASSLSAGARDEFSVGAQAALGRTWALGFEWRRVHQRTSAAVPIYRGGVAAGTVFQPRIAIGDVQLTLARRF